MTQYRKKPVVIEAHQFVGTDESFMNIRAFILEGGGTVTTVSSPVYTDVQGVQTLSAYEELIGIVTLEGTMTVSNGDWVIKGVQGEFYPCKPEIFEATYEKV